MKNLLLAVFMIVLFMNNLNAKDIVFGVYTSDKASVMYTTFKPIVEYLEDEAKKNGLEIKISFKIYKTYEAALDGIVKGEYDFARFGPASYVLAKEQSKNIKLIAIEHTKNEKTFKGVFITLENSGINSLKDLKGKSFAFGDPQSTIGRYLAQAEMLDMGISSKDLSHYEYLDRHDKVALAVVNKNYDAGVVKEKTFKEYKNRGLKQIASFENVTKPWLAKADLDPKIYQFLKQSLLKLKDKTILKGLKNDGFLEASDKDYEITRIQMEKSKKF